MSDKGRPWSLRSRLVLIASLACLATLVAGFGSMVGAARSSNSTLQDERLEELAEAVCAFAEVEIAEILGHGQTELIHLEPAGKSDSRYHFQIWTMHGNLLLRSKGAGASPMLPMGQMGFATIQAGEKKRRVFAKQSDDGAEMIQVGEDLDERDAGVSLIGRYFMSFLIPPFIAILAVTLWMLRRSLHALDASAQQLQARSPIDLSPVYYDNPPAELKPMIASVNSLFKRIDTALSTERGFTSVAAHELRTPLAGLRAQAQIASTAQSPEELSESLAQVMSGVDRAARLLDQLLDLARVDSASGHAQALREPLDAAAAFDNAMLDLGARAAARGIRIRCEFAEPRIRAMEGGYVLLLRNLLSNAIRHTPDGGRIRVATSRDAHGSILVVEDSGPGIPEPLRQRAFERFDRLGARDDAGVGLGMSIVRSVVLAHGATIQLLESPLGGLRVWVHFPDNAS